MVRERLSRINSEVIITTAVIDFLCVGAVVTKLVNIDLINTPVPVIAFVAYNGLTLINALERYITHNSKSK